MSFRSRAFFFALTAELAISSHAVAAELRPGTLELDPSKTQIEFRLPGALHTTHGTFKLERGTINADPRTGEASGDIEVDAANGDSGLAARDRRMTESVLETGKYPKIVFRPLYVHGQMDSEGEFRAVLEGVMTLHGSEHEMVIDAVGRLIGQELTATCHFSVPYVEWGMEDPSLLFFRVAKQVDIDVTTAGSVVWRISASGKAQQ